MECLAWQQKTKAIIICISHDMEQLAEVCQRLLVLQHGRLVMDKPIKEAFVETEILQAAGLRAPLPCVFLAALKAAGWQIESDAITVGAAAEAVVAGLVFLAVDMENLVPGAADHREQGRISSAPVCGIPLPHILESCLIVFETVNFRSVFIDDDTDFIILHCE